MTKTVLINIVENPTGDYDFIFVTSDNSQIKSNKKYYFVDFEERCGQGKFFTGYVYIEKNDSGEYIDWEFEVDISKPIEKLNLDLVIRKGKK